MRLDVIEQGHKAAIHMQLLVAVEEHEAGMIRNKVDFGFLVTMARSGATFRAISTRAPRTDS